MEDEDFEKFLADSDDDDDSVSMEDGRVGRLEKMKVQRGNKSASMRSTGQEYYSNSSFGAVENFDFDRLDSEAFSSHFESGLLDSNVSRYGDMIGVDGWDVDNMGDGVLGGSRLGQNRGNDQYNFELGDLSLSESGSRKTKTKTKKKKRETEKERRERDMRNRELSKSREERLEELLGQVNSEREAAKRKEEERLRQERLRREELERQQQLQREAEMRRQREEELERMHANQGHLEEEEVSFASDSLELSSADFEVGGYQARKLREAKPNTPPPAFEEEDLDDNSLADEQRNDLGKDEDEENDEPKGEKVRLKAELEKDSTELVNRLSFEDLSELMQASVKEDEEDNTSEHQSPTPKSRSPSSSSAWKFPLEFRVGDRIMAKLPQWGRFYLGKISSVNPDASTYNVEFDDGERVDDIQAENIQLVTKDRPTEDQGEQSSANQSALLSLQQGENSIPSGALPMGSKSPVQQSTHITEQASVQHESPSKERSDPQHELVVSEADDQTSNDHECPNQGSAVVNDATPATEQQGSSLQENDDEKNRRIEQSQSIEENEPSKEQDKGVAHREKEQEHFTTPPKKSAREKFWAAMRVAPDTKGTPPPPPPPQVPPPPPPPPESTKPEFRIDGEPPPPPPPESPGLMMTYEVIRGPPPQRSNLRKPPVERIAKDEERGIDINQAYYELSLREASLIQELQETNSALLSERDRVKGLHAELKSAKAEIFALRSQLHEIESTNATRIALREKVKSGKADDSTPISNEEMIRLEKEISEQEVLLQGYQKENEKLVAQLREAEKRADATRQAMLKENQRLLNTSSARSPENSHHTRTAEELRKRLGTEGELQSMRQELEEERKRFRERLQEMKNEMDKLRREKRDLECRFGGLEGGAVALQRGSDDSITQKQIEELRKELAQARFEHLTEAKALKEKLAWYAENQEMLNANDELIAEQKRIIKQLKQEINGGDGSSSLTVSKTKRSLPGDVKRIRHLEAQLKEMETALRKRNPDCLANLIRAAGPSEDEKRTVKELRMRIQSLEEEIKEREEASKKRTRSLRQELERMKVHYERKIELVSNENNENSHGQQHIQKGHSSTNFESKVKALEQELDRVRTFYRKKIEDLSKKSSNMARASSRRGEDQSVQSAQRDADKLRAAKLALEARVEELELLLADPSKNDPSEKALESLKKENENLRQRLKTMMSSRNGPRQAWNKGGRINSTTTDASQPEPLSLLDAIEAVEQSSLAAPPSPIQKPNLAEKQLREALAESENARMKLEDRLKQLAATPPPSNAKELEFYSKALERSENAVQRMHQQVVTLESELRDARQRLKIPQTPSMVQHQSLCRRIEELEERNNRRERELEHVVQQVRQRAELDMQLAKSQFETEMAKKNEELKRFRMEIDELVQQVQNYV